MSPLCLVASDLTYRVNSGFLNWDIWLGLIICCDENSERYIETIFDWDEISWPDCSKQHL